MLTRKRPHIILAAAGLLGLLLSLAAGASLARAAPAVHSAAAAPGASDVPVEICQTDRGMLCLNRDHGGTTEGTEVIGYYQGNENNSFALLPLSQACGDGHVHSALNCPNFGPSEVTASVDGAILVALYDYRTGLCLAAGGQLWTCPTIQGFDGDGGKHGMVFAASNCGQYTTCSVTSYLNAYWSQVNAGARWMEIPILAGERVNLGDPNQTTYALLQSS